ncbi:GerMN domain-containing protein [Sphaerimonospora thailandensis]|uniref:Sporulation and spore germination protein n=1 Tax=Sphaerimonospora thailandensis TaxID=795644 RepID=A0A8J3R4U5_9ACTN|nr:GerMN domain-containing protein [Sphaerimonospora thailandensis]GIH68513.1 hypothetical protein Mth01_07660 [Sphaerimonospora thailandensis]
MSRARPLAALAVPLMTATILAAPAAAAPVPAAVPIPSTARTGAARPVSTLVDIRAAHHRGLDRLVFEFRGPLPATRRASYVSSLIADGSGNRVQVAGDAILQVRFGHAVGHDSRGAGTYGPTRETYPLPGVIQVVNAGDFEGVLSFGVGLSRRTPYRMYTLTHPNRVVIDIKTPFRTVPVKTFLHNSRAYAAGREPYTVAVRRPVIPPATARGALQRLFAGPTRAEYARGLRFVNSKATGFSSLTVRDGVARVRLTGKITSGGSTYTIADQITPTLKQFPGIRWVKIYDRFGRTQHPTGRSDSIPSSLEP